MEIIEAKQQRTTVGGYSRETLAETPGRVGDFFGGVRHPPIWAAMCGVGFGQAALEQGLRLFVEACGLTPGGPGPVLAPDVLEAVAALDKLDEPLLRIAGATLSHRLPDQASFLLSELAPGSGTDAVLTLAVFFERLGALERGRSELTRADDAKASELLAQRGMPAAERTRIRELLKKAQSPTAVGATPSDDAAEKTRLEALAALKAWYDEWAEIAHAVIRRRDHLIRLGLAQRRQAGAKAEPAPAPTPA